MLKPGIVASRIPAAAQAAGVTWNPNDKSTRITLTESDLVASGNATGVQAACVRATLSRNAGKYAYTIDPSFSGNWDDGLGIANGTFLVTDALGETAHGLGYLENGNVRLNAVTIATMPAWSGTNIVMFAVDIDARRLWIRHDTGNWNNDANADPSTGTGGFDISGVTGALFPTYMLKVQDSSARGKFNAASLTNIPSGFAAWDS